MSAPRIMDLIARKYGEQVEESDRFDVVILGFEPRAELPELRLQRAFGIDAPTAAQLITHLPRTVQRAVSRVRAEYFRRALGLLGAQVEVRTPEGHTVGSIELDTSEDELTPLDPAVAPTDFPPAPEAHAQAKSPRALADLSAPESDAWARPRPAWVNPISPTLGATRPKPPAISAVAAEAISPPGLMSANTTLREATTPNLPGLTASKAAEVTALPPTLLNIAAPFGSRALVAKQLANPAYPALFGADAAPAEARSQAKAAAPGIEANNAPNDSAPRDPPDRAQALARPDVDPVWPRVPSSVWDPAPAPQTPEPYPQVDIEPHANKKHADRPLQLPPIPAQKQDADREVPLPAVLQLQLDAPRFDIAKQKFHLPPARDELQLEPGPLSRLELASLAAPPAASRKKPAPAHLDAPLGDALKLDADPYEGQHASPLILGRVLSPWEQPNAQSMAEPDPHFHSSRPLAPPLKPPLAPAPQPKAKHPRAPRAGAVRGAPPQAGEQSALVERRGARGSDKNAAASAVREPRVALDSRSFWQSFGEALVLPFSGPGPYWLGAITAWSVLVGVLDSLAGFASGVGWLLMFCSHTSQLAFACDYYQQCMWIPASGKKALERAPELDPARILDRYIKSGLHLSCFMLASQIPLAYWVFHNLSARVSVLDIATAPLSWLLALLPYYYWPMGVARTALSHNFAAIWNVPAGVRAIVRAPFEYSAIALVGVVALLASWLGLLVFGSFFGVTGAVVSAAIGLPLAISHGLQGALMGHLIRARADAFE